MHKRDIGQIVARPSLEAAPLLLGCHIVREYQGKELRVRIVEVEAYDQLDAASHTYRGMTPRNRSMFGPPGHAYVYFTYGMHYCLNIVTGKEGWGSGVLIRAVEPIAGREIMERNRRTDTLLQLTSGPAKLCQALEVDRALDGHDLARKPLQLELGEHVQSGDIVQTVRVGITKAVHEPWRFYIAGNPFVSKL